jgi:hypothetical protein
MAKRSRKAVVEVGLRVREPLRAKVEKAAKARGVSMNAEMVARLERSFATEEVWGGPEMLRVAELMAGAFYHTGLSASVGREPADWLGDPAVYSDCMRAVERSLSRGIEGLSPSPRDWRAFLAHERQRRGQNGVDRSQFNKMRVGFEALKDLLTDLEEQITAVEAERHNQAKDKQQAQDTEQSTEESGNDD